MNFIEENPPVLLVIFNRPEKTRRVFKAIRQVKPGRLFVAADGPRPDHPEDIEKCNLARQAATNIDWPCDLKTRFIDKNVGCEFGVASAIGWFFDHVEHGIILEDDCVPHPHFFPFCRELFKRYAYDLRIMQISGFAPYAMREHPYDYHFSGAGRCAGGWGTWRRAWKHFTFSLDQYSDIEALEILKNYFPDREILQAKFKQFLQFKNGMFNNWDFLWNIACFSQNGLCIVPEKNLMTNIGFDQEGTHTRRFEPFFANSEGHPLEFPLRHPPYVYADGRPERCLEKAIHRTLPFKSRCVKRIRQVLAAIF